MSNVPDSSAWWADHPHSWAAMPPSGAGGAVRVPPPSIGWRLARSLWLLIPLFGCGFFGGAALIFVGAYVRKVSWWVAGIGYLLLSIVAFVVSGAMPNAPVWSDIALGTLMVSWLVCIVHCLLVNVWWLRLLRAGRRWYNSPATAWPAGGGWAPPVPTGPVAPAYVGVSMEPGPPAGTGPPVGPWAAAGGGASPGPLDVNFATAAELAALAGFDPVRSERVIQARQVLAGFTSTAQFAEAAGLAPHEFARIRGRITCGPRPTAPQAEVDPQVPPPQGRILDV